MSTEQWDRPRAYDAAGRGTAGRYTSYLAGDGGQILNNGRDGANGQARLAGALGLLSLGLGIAQVAAPGEVARLIGVRDDDRSRDLLRTVGIREIVNGLAILAQTRPVAPLWARVAGDAMDLALLGSALRSEETDRSRAAAAAAAVAGVAALDLLASSTMAHRVEGDTPLERSGLNVVRAITIRRPAKELYAFWSDLGNLPRIMRTVEEIRVLDDRRSHWRVQGPGGRSVEWDSEITEDVPGERIAWRTLPGAQVRHTGQVSFAPAPGDRGTEVRLEMRYLPPGGMFGEKLAAMFGKDPSAQALEDLRNFKQVMETGEVVVSDGSLMGLQFPQHPAQPAALPPMGEAR